MSKKFGTTNIYEIRNKIQNNTDLYNIVNLNFYYTLRIELKIVQVVRIELK